MDPLSDVLLLLKLQTYAAGGFDLGGAWSIRFDAYSGIKCYALLSGACWLLVEGCDEPVPLVGGDCVLLLGGRPFQLASDLDLEPIPFADLFKLERKGGIPVLSGGGTMILGAHFAFAGAHADSLLGAMPRIVRLSEDADRASLRWSLRRMREELLEARPGADLVAQYLAHMILVQVLRLYLAENRGRSVGWLFALADPPVAAAISAIHADPGARWTLQALAERAAMSRSSFARRFSAAVGSAPIEYLTRWRMLLAGDRMARGTEPLYEIALSLGYESESAFSTAFKRTMGCSPRRYAQSVSPPNADTNRRG